MSTLVSHASTSGRALFPRWHAVLMRLPQMSPSPTCTPLRGAGTHMCWNLVWILQRHTLKWLCVCVCAAYWEMSSHSGFSDKACYRVLGGTKRAGREGAHLCLDLSLCLSFLFLKRKSIIPPLIAFFYLKSPFRGELPRSSCEQMTSALTCCDFF